MIQVKMLRCTLMQDNGAKWPPLFAMLDMSIDQIFHSGERWIREDRSVTQCARSKLRASLKPAHNMAIC